MKPPIGRGPKPATEPASVEADLHKEAIDLRRKLIEAQSHLRESEAELDQLRATVENQSSELHM